MPKDRRILRNVVARLVGLGRNIRYIFTYLKMDSKFKYTTDKIISATINFVKGAFGLGKAANSAKRDTPIKNLGDGLSGAKKKKLCVNYEFIHSANGKTKRGSSPNSSELGSIEANPDDKIGDIKDKIMEKIRAWIDAHYEDSNLRLIKSTLRITSIMEC